MSMTSMKWALILGFGSLGVGLGFARLGDNFELVSNYLFLIAVIFGLIQLAFHIHSIFEMQETPLFFKIISTWFLLAFGLISGYVITITCMITASEDLATLLRRRRSVAATNTKR